MQTSSRRNIDDQTEKVYLEGIIDSDQYKLTGSLGRGTWGRVYAAEDIVTGQKDLAIKILDPTPLAKEQMGHRNLDKTKVVLNESRRFAACSNVVPGNIDIDENGLPFIVMPRYDKFLSDVLNDEGERKYLGKGLDLKKVNFYLEGIARGLSEVHNKIGRAHSDIKPDNVALDNKDGRPLINDLGTSTCASLTGASVSPRDNMGFVHTRDPKCFRQGSHPTGESDTYAFFAIAYRMLSKDGKYPFEGELMQDPEFFKNTKEKDYKLILKKKLKQVPREYRKMLEHCGDIHQWFRPHNAEYLVSSLEEITTGQDTWGVLKDRAKKVLLPTAIGSAILGGVLYLSQVYEPRDIKIPDININGAISLEDKSERNIVFDKEDPNFLDLPKPDKSGPMLDMDFQDRIAKYTSRNRYVVALLDSYNSAIVRGGVFNRPDGIDDNRGYFTGEQFKIFQASIRGSQGPMGVGYAGEIHHKVVANAIEYALSESVRPDGKVDLEDTLAIALEGSTKVNMAKRASNSFDFRKYIKAKDEQGKYIISENNQDFIKRWLIQTYYREDPRAFFERPDGIN